MASYACERQRVMHTQVAWNKIPILLFPFLAAVHKISPQRKMRVKNTLPFGQRMAHASGLWPNWFYKHFYFYVFAA